MKQSNFSAIPILFILFLTFGLASMASAQDYSYRVARDGFVSGYFIGQTAAYDSDLSIIADGYPGSDRHISNHVAKPGEMTTFGWFEAGTELTFKLFVQNTGDTFYSDTSMNFDNTEHARAFPLMLPSGTLSLFTPTIFMGFEDLRGGDMDFNDNMAVFSNVIMSPVPEPTTWAMLIAGLALLTLNRKSFLS